MFIQYEYELPFVATRCYEYVRCCCCWLAVGCRLSVVGCRLSVVGCWSWVVCCLVVVGEWVVGEWVVVVSFITEIQSFGLPFHHMQNKLYNMKSIQHIVYCLEQSNGPGAGESEGCMPRRRRHMVALRGFRTLHTFGDVHQFVYGVRVNLVAATGAELRVSLLPPPGSVTSQNLHKMRGSKW